MNFYEFNQNNSGGHFDVDENVCHRVFIEAENECQAISIFKPMIENQTGSCPCCGDRWYLDPTVIDTLDIEQYAQSLSNEYGWTKPDIIIHYMNGSKKKIYTKEK